MAKQETPEEAWARLNREIEEETIKENKMQYAKGFRFRGDYWWHHNGGGDDTQHYFYFTVNPTTTTNPQSVKYLKKINRRCMGDIVFSEMHEDGTTTRIPSK